MSAEQIYWINDHLEAVEERIYALPGAAQLALCGVIFLVGTLLPVALGF